MQKCVAYMYTPLFRHRAELIDVVFFYYFLSFLFLGHVVKTDEIIAKTEHSMYAIV